MVLVVVYKSLDIGGVGYMVSNSISKVGIKAPPLEIDSLVFFERNKV